MISNLVKDSVRTRMDQVGRVLGRTGLTPDMASLLGLVINGAVAVVLATGRFGLGGLLLLLAAPFDLLDGALARATGKGSTFGAFLDSNLDRYSEVILFFGVLWHVQHDPTHATLRTLLIYGCATGSLLVSYARARAEALGFDNEVGILARPERVVGLGAFLLFGWTDAILWALAVLTYVTAVQRLVHVWLHWRRQPTR
ncbi:MAG: CDP-alcohol phosphatidyltransferase family protein [Chloroflexota bacterium]|nr:CDP-alcohol phosphatidyltransferase family protein [Chloroflexota bacterium]